MKQFAMSGSVPSAGFGTTFFLLVILYLFVGCGSRSALAPAPTFVPSPNSTATVAILATETPMVPQWSNAEMLRVLPMRRGARWVYRARQYDTLPNDLLPDLTMRQITATLLITDTVTETQTRGLYYAARVSRVRTILETSIALNLLGEVGETYFGNDVAFDRWFIFSNDKIYVQWERLEWDTFEQAPLQYIFPLELGARWYPDAEQRAQFAPDDPRDIPGYRMILPSDTKSPFAAPDSECYQIRERYNPGDTIEEFCTGVGVVAEHFDHAGTPFGFHSELVQFTQGE